MTRFRNPTCKYSLVLLQSGGLQPLSRPLPAFLVGPAADRLGPANRFQAAEARIRPCEGLGAASRRRGDSPVASDVGNSGGRERPPEPITASGRAAPFRVPRQTPGVPAVTDGFGTDYKKLTLSHPFQASCITRTRVTRMRPARIHDESHRLPSSSSVPPHAHARRGTGTRADRHGSHAA